MAEPAIATHAAQAAPVRGRLPSLQPVQAQALRRFFGAAQRWFLNDGGLLTFSPGAAGNAGETFGVDADGSVLPLRLDAAAPLQPGLRWSDYGGRSRMLAWSLAHEPQLMRLSEGLGISLLPVESPSGAALLESDEDGLWLDFAIDDEPAEDGAPQPARTRGAVRFPTAWLDRLLARAEPIYVDDPLPEIEQWLHLPAQVALECAGPVLDQDEWDELQVGDVILAGNRRAPAVFEAHASGRAWPLAPTAAGWRVEAEARTVTTPRYPEPSIMMNDPELTPEDGGEDTPAAEDHPARRLPVQLVFDIGQIEMTVGDLASLQPGYVFALPSHLEGANVTIRANGSRAGRGEIVAVGDTLGVRLLSWA
ncbi:type III secretion system cytoplasmic ring protein SctQ [Luteimonas aquatica]|uniref:type III secretion system cytoplasmic ring protein SctQ n=1 Tax=Luteimonas aquatica TaxID=450364 RepID=UPI001F561FF5|nr:type III secretion system cytoplasmic ring protein SctQ [Luteimonas aquatica]